MYQLTISNDSYDSEFKMLSVDRTFRNFQDLSSIE